MNLANIPDEMHALKNWCVWRLEKIGGRDTKIPYNALTGAKAKSNDPVTWCGFSEAARAVNGSGKYKGVGFMLSDSPYVCVDLDHCLDGGEKETWARGIVEQIGGYVEVSQSGHGLHIFGRAAIVRDRRTDGIEIYGNNRYIAMTGDVWEGRGALSDIQSGIDALMAEYFPDDGGKAGIYSKSELPTPAKHPHGGGEQQGAAAQSGADRDVNAPNRPPHVDAVIAKMRKGERPKPAAYLCPNYIAVHLSTFAQGASYIVPKDILDKYGRALIGRPDNCQFVIPKEQMDCLLEQANGSVEKIEAALGVPHGKWAGRELSRIDVLCPTDFHLRMPTGNEEGVNELWLPGGYLWQGYREAIISQVPEGAYVETKIMTND